MPYFGLIKENMDPSHIDLAIQKKKYWSYLGFFVVKESRLEITNLLA